MLPSQGGICGPSISPNGLSDRALKNGWLQLQRQPVRAATSGPTPTFIASWCSQRANPWQGGHHRGVGQKLQGGLANTQKAWHASRPAPARMFRPSTARTSCFCFRPKLCSRTTPSQRSVADSCGQIYGRADHARKKRLVKKAIGHHGLLPAQRPGRSLTSPRTPTHASEDQQARKLHWRRIVPLFPFLPILTILRDVALCVGLDDGGHASVACCRRDRSREGGGEGSLGLGRVVTPPPPPSPPPSSKPQTSLRLFWLGRMAGR